MRIPKCLKCQSFGWWDGDYVCMEHFKILSKVHDKWMIDDDLIKSLRKNGQCEDFVLSCNMMVKNMYIEEYMHWKELHDLEKQLERHVK